MKHRILTALLLASTPLLGVASSKNLEKSLQGNWKLQSLSCNGVPQPIDKDYALSFSGASGAYVSTVKGCTQTEPETYRYLPENKLSIKSGVRACAPNPCAADLPATECGKETNPVAALFDVTVKGNDQFILSTSDPKSVDCIGPGQKKPAVFVFVKK